MSDKNTVGPAFPVAESASGQFPAHPGMDLRDFFAAQALSGWMSGLRGAQVITPTQQDEVAEGMYSMADAMLKAREQ